MDESTHHTCENISVAEYTTSCLKENISGGDNKGHDEYVIKLLKCMMYNGFLSHIQTQCVQFHT